MSQENKVFIQVSDSQNVNITATVDQQNTQEDSGWGAFFGFLVIIGVVLAFTGFPVWMIVGGLLITAIAIPIAGVICFFVGFLVRGMGDEQFREKVLNSDYEMTRTDAVFNVIAGALVIAVVWMLFF